MKGPPLAPAVIDMVGTRGFVRALTAGFVLVAVFSWTGVRTAAAVGTADEAGAGAPVKPAAPLRLSAAFALVRMALFLLVIVMSYSFKGTRIWKTSSKTS